MDLEHDSPDQVGELVLVAGHDIRPEVPAKAGEERRGGWGGSAHSQVQKNASIVL